MAASDGDALTEPNTTDDTAGGTANGIGGGGAGELSAAARDWVRRLVADWDPLTDEERAYLAYMFHRRT